VVDDILDFIGTEEELGKPAGSDLTQGTLTLPAMLLNQRYPEDNPVKRLFENAQKTENIKLAIETGAQFLDSGRMLPDCPQVLRRSLPLCSRVTGTNQPPGLLELADFVVERKT